MVPLANAILSPSQTMDLLHPICLASCPQDRSTFHPCLSDIETQRQVPRNFDGSFWVNNTYISHLVQDIETMLFAQRFCLPKDNFLVEQLNQTLSGSMNAVMYKAQEIVDARRVYILAGGMAILMCYVYLFAIDLLAAPIIYIMLFLATGGSYATSLYFFYAALRVDLGAALAVEVEALPLVESTNDRNWDLVIAIVCLVLGIAATCFWCCKKSSISFVIAAVKATIRILYDVPQLILLPAVGAVIRGLVFIIFLWGGALLVSAGEIEQVDLSQYVPKGIARSFTHTQDQTMYIVYYCFVVFWMWEFLLALETFVAAYAVVVWYNAPVSDGKKRVPCFPVVRAFLMGLSYHFGSLLFGAVILAIFRFAYVLVSLLESQAAIEGYGGSGATEAAGKTRCEQKSFHELLPSTAYSASQREPSAFAFFR
ncbi:slc44a2 [Symbiodinium natans]|uniref:Choline transporter-like protein n=1 Tax=Symbiodinium natans TaxID=878477 RepID=A0A812IQW5_9DINO|nr:slc44a2 [Symbiodinium natans]